MTLWLWVLLGYCCNTLALLFTIVLLDTFGRKKFIKALLMLFFLIPWALTGLFIAGVLGGGVGAILYIGGKEIIRWWKDEE
jgi:ABC-type sugar transport system permease subunit